MIPMLNIDFSDEDESRDDAIGEGYPVQIEDPNGRHENERDSTEKISIPLHS
jgi:hypothetical protein